MLSYTFSRREKILIVVLAVILVGLAWFVFVFQRTNDELIRIDGELAAVQTESTVITQKVAEMNKMQATVDQRKAEGAQKKTVPAYDNLTALMTELNSIMSASSDFVMEFDEVDMSNPDYVKRGVRIDFACDSYAQAEQIIKSLAQGKYPCSVDTISIVDNSLSKSSRNVTVRNLGAGNVASSIHVTFLEKPAK